MGPGRHAFQRAAIRFTANSRSPVPASHRVTPRHLPTNSTGLRASTNCTWRQIQPRIDDHDSAAAAYFATLPASLSDLQLPSSCRAFLRPTKPYQAQSCVFVTALFFRAKCANRPTNPIRNASTIFCGNNSHDDRMAYESVIRRALRYSRARGTRGSESSANRVRRLHLAAGQRKARHPTNRFSAAFFCSQAEGCALTRAHRGSGGFLPRVHTLTRSRSRAHARTLTIYGLRTKD